MQLRQQASLSGQQCSWDGTKDLITIISKLSPYALMCLVANPGNVDRHR